VKVSEGTVRWFFFAAGFAWGIAALLLLAVIAVST
jgi:hypothetical protein